jgi:hypothetical protein
MNRVGETLGVVKNAVALGLADAELKQLRTSAHQTMTKLHEAHESHFALVSTARRCSCRAWTAQYLTARCNINSQTKAHLLQQLLDSTDDASASASLNAATREGLSPEIAATIAFEHGHKIGDKEFALRVYGDPLMEQGIWSPKKKNALLIEILKAKKIDSLKPKRSIL